MTRLRTVNDISDMTTPDVFESACLSNDLQGVTDGFINIYAHGPVAKITALPQGNATSILVNSDGVQQFWNSEDINFSLAGTRFYTKIEVIAKRYDADGTLSSEIRDITPPIPQDGSLPLPMLEVSPNGVISLGTWEVTVTVQGLSEGTEDTDTVTFVVMPHHVELQAYHLGNIEIDEDPNSPTFGTIIDGLVTQDAYNVSGMPPLKVLFVAPNTTTGQISLDFGDGIDGLPNRAIVPRTLTIQKDGDGRIISGPNFEYEYEYLIPAGFDYRPQAAIITNSALNIMLFSDRNVSINVQTALLEIIDPFPSSGGFIPRTVTVNARTNAGALRAVGLINDAGFGLSFNGTPPKINTPCQNR